MDAKQRKKELRLGIFLMIVFLVVLAGVFSPIFNGKNGLEYMDNLYNSISKGSAYYIPAMVETAETLKGQKIDTTLEIGNALQAERIATLFRVNGADATASQGNVAVSGDLGELYLAALEDTEAIYQNNEKAVESRYGYEGRAALYNWWVVSKALDKTLTKQKLFEPAKKIGAIKNKAIETAYNYYGIEPEKISNKIGIVTGSLVFYVIYTLWYGFSILFMFEGTGFRLEH